MTPCAAGRICLFFSAFLIPLFAQQAQLRIVMIQGEGALNNTGGRANRDVIVEVQGADARPVAGALVTFNLPLTGPGGTFPNGERALTVTSGADGRATAAGIRPNGVTGPLQIRVSATYRDQTATAVIQQTNVAATVEEPKPTPPPVTSTTTIPPRPAPKRGLSTTAKVLLILAIAGGAAAGATVALTRDGSSGGGGGGGGGTPPIVITPGAPSVGGPQ